MSWIEVRLTAESGERTRLELEHIAMIDDQDEHFGQYGPGAVGIGWDLSALGLALYLSGNGMRDAAAAEEWAVSPEGQQFSRLSGEQWCRADIASGTDAAEAQRRSDNTIAFYTGTA